MHRIRLVGLILAVAATLSAGAGCGGSSSSPSGTTGDTEGTTGTPATPKCVMSGAYSKSEDCSLWPPPFMNANGKLTYFAISAPDLAVSISFSGPPTVHTYKNADSDALSMLLVTTNNGQGPAWQALADSTGSVPATGSYELTLTSVDVTSATTAETIYTLHGSLHAFLPAHAASGATGTVELKVRF